MRTEVLKGALLTLVISSLLASVTLSTLNLTTPASTSSGAQIWMGDAEENLAPTADSWVELTKPSTNKGGDSTIHVLVKWDERKGVVTNLRRSYLKFDLSGLSPGAMITSAKLHLYREGDTDIPSVYHTTDNWTENGITWNNQPGPGALENNNGTVSGNWIEWGITSYAASEYAGDKVLSVVLKFETESGSDQHADFTSREGTWDQRPWLEISCISIVTPPGLLTPSDGTLTNDNTPTFEWENTYVADNYEVWVDNDPDFSSPKILENTAENTYTPTTELPDENYSWKVRAYLGADASDFSENWTFVIDTVPPGIPALISPADGAITNDHTPTFEWSAVSDPSGVTYTLQVDNDSDFTSPEVNVPGLTENTYTPSALADENYSWRVRAVDNAGNVGPWSSVWTLLIKTVVRGVEVSISPESRMGLPGENLTYTVTVTNTGNVPDNYALENIDTLGWGLSISEDLLEVENGMSVNVTLTVAIPDNALGRTLDNITVIATSQENENIWDNKSCLAHVRVVVRVDVRIEPSWQRYFVGENLSYAITVVNTGNVPDNYTLTVEDNAGWGPSLSENRLENIWPGENKPATLRVTIPENATAGTEDNVIVKATSAENAEISDNASCIAHATVPKAEFSFITLYKVSLDVNLYLENGSKLVVKFYKYDNTTLQAESVIDEFTPSKHVENIEIVPHPLGLPVEIVTLVLTTDNTEEVIYTIASFVVRKVDLEMRFMKIPMWWAAASPEGKVELEIEFMKIPMYWAGAPS